MQTVNLTRHGHTFLIRFTAKSALAGLHEPHLIRWVNDDRLPLDASDALSLVNRMFERLKGPTIRIAV